MKIPLHFAHGNGFPSLCYQQVLRRLEPDFDCYYIDKVGHSSLFPVTDNWHHLVREIIASIQQQTSSPVVAVGHSLGGVLHLLAAFLEPSLFKAVILLDSPMLSRIKSNLIFLSKKIGMIDRITPASRTKERRCHWSTRSEAVSYLKSRALFKGFTDEALNDYIDYGMQPSSNGYVLRFDPQIEYQIYRTIPHTGYRYEGHLQVPTTLIYGDHSTVIRRTDVHYMKKHYGISAIKTQGTHMFPMEHPDITAMLIRETVARLIH